ncbi:MAG: radical SAM protein, partial [Candidatus Aminicenantes bacterium]|nr:radical SAM protein [Candidatus Aminicenantes bacterium]
MPWTAAEARIWMAGLKREASASSATDMRFDTLYLGGGTPSLLDGPAVAAVRDLAHAHFPMEIAEFTLEANPSAGASGRLRGWREAGVSRLSVGVQSFDDDILRTLGRRYSGDEALRFCRSARE